jgi:hypothetical protein
LKRFEGHDKQRSEDPRWDKQIQHQGKKEQIHCGEREIEQR